MDLQICRICFVNVDADNSLVLQDFADIIMLTTSVKISASDGLPQLICKICSTRAREAFTFRMLCEESDIILRSHEILNLEENNSDDITTETANEIIENEKQKEPLKCRSCSMVFYYKKPLLKHEKKHIEGFSCKDCGKIYSSAKHLAIHVNIKKRKGSHLCQVCGKAYTMPENLKRHQRVHDGIRPFTCQICDKSFTQSNELKSHMISHSSEKKFLCNFCGHKYARETSLQVHITRIHTSMTKQYKCHVCDRAFKGLVDMKVHQSIHIGDRKHICKVCDKAFNKSSNLKVHERIHTGQRPFVCQVCQKSFIQKHVLNKHLRIHVAQD